MTVVAEAKSQGADALTPGGRAIESRASDSAAGAAFGMKVVLVVNGMSKRIRTANARPGSAVRRRNSARFIARRAGARYGTGGRRSSGAGHRPFVASWRIHGDRCPRFRARCRRAFGFRIKPDVILHASSSGGTQAGLIAGRALLGLRANVIGISADESSESLRNCFWPLTQWRKGWAPNARQLDGGRQIDVDDSQAGGGCGVPTTASTEALELVARREGILLDPVYTAKAFAGLVARVRAGAFEPGQTVLFWHTGGQVGYFA